MSAIQPQNMHGTAVVIGDRGVLIVGASGSGKTTLALALIDAARIAGRFARLVSDDQLFVHVVDGKLLVEAPRAIRGLVEIHGVGPHPFANEDRALIDRLVRLAPASPALRFPEEQAEEIAGVSLPLLMVAERNAPAGVTAIRVRLDF